MPTLTPHPLKIFATLKEAWDLVKGSKSAFWAIIGFIIVTEIFLFLIGKIPRLISPDVGFIRTIAFTLKIAIYLLQEILSWGLIYLGIQRAAGLPIEYAMISKIFDIGLILKMIGTRILNLLLIIVIPSLIIGFTAAMYHANPSSDIIKLTATFLYLVALGLFIFFWIRLLLASAIVIAQKVYPWTAIKLSFVASQSNFWNILWLFLLQILIVILAIIPLGLGLIWAFPLFFITYGMIYKKLVLPSQEIT